MGSRSGGRSGRNNQIIKSNAQHSLRHLSMEMSNIKKGRKTLASKKRGPAAFVCGGQWDMC